MYAGSPCVRPDQAQLDGDEALCFKRGEINTGSQVFALVGIVDARSGKLLQDIPRLVESAVVIIDFANVKRINSMGIALLLRCFKQIKEEKGSELQVSGLNEVNMMLFKMTGVFQLVKLSEKAVG